MTLTRRDGIFLLAAVLAVGLYVLMAQQRDRFGFPLDDSWIHQVYARNLAEHGEWAFVPGESSAASTAPLYSTLMAAGQVFNLHPVFTASVFGVLVLTLGAMMAARIGEQLFPDMAYVGLATGLTVLTAWHVVWAAASGMETMLFMALSLTLMYVAFRELDYFSALDELDTPADTRRQQKKQRRRINTMQQIKPAVVIRRGLVMGVVGGLLTLTRPEGVILVGLVGLFALIAFGADDPQRYLYWSVGVALGWLVVIAPYVYLNYHLTGGILPDTADAKIAENAILRQQSILTRYGKMILPLAAGAQLIALPGIIVGLWLIIRKIRENRHAVLLLVPIVWAIVHITVYVVRLPAPYQHGRYVMPVLPALLIYAAGGMLYLVEIGKHTAPARVATRSLALSAAMAFPAFMWIGAGAYANDVRIINTEMVETAKWVRDNVPPEELFAVHDIGALGYYAPRHILDLAGLVTPELVPFIRDRERLMQFMCENDAKWLMVLPDQRPADADDLRLSLAYESPYNFANAAQGDSPEAWKMRVYQLNCDAGG